MSKFTCADCAMLVTSEDGSFHCAIINPYPVKRIPADRACLQLTLKRYGHG